MLSAAELPLEPLRETAAPGYTYVPELRVFAHDMFAVLLEKIREELADPEFKGRRHARHATHNRGCGGPLCRRARQNWQNSYSKTKAEMKGREYQTRVSFEKAITEPLFLAWCKYIDEQYEAERQARLEARKQQKLLARKIQRAIDRDAKICVTQEVGPPENLQTAEFADSIMADSLLVAELI